VRQSGKRVGGLRRGVSRARRLLLKPWSRQRSVPGDTERDELELDSGGGEGRSSIPKGRPARGLKRRPSRGPASGERGGLGLSGEAGNSSENHGKLRSPPGSVNGPNVQPKRVSLDPGANPFLLWPRSELAAPDRSGASARAAERRLPAAAATRNQGAGRRPLRARSERSLPVWLRKQQRLAARGPSCRPRYPPNHSAHRPSGWAPSSDR
jgi:hypothetical protein